MTVHTLSDADITQALNTAKTVVADQKLVPLILTLVEHQQLYDEPPEKGLIQLINRSSGGHHEY
ncbi:hypothetical protein BS333_21420 (plasmid) [Vibrio azureus]|uniref:Uncharacterized protein n=1 Tax=Vibrio azureus NBRC 104587 TaxID=1219077 RepID=U3CCY8_9VIBR|nr:hypothetical protein [Vibrio azureus]AUI88943.1 hypothetical protein BS333_21420 [Vibrio azureus]GAD76208.1 hypothetical protein VAZ01S_039_00330 [Vibrio azureus NBRC 104587]